MWKVNACHDEYAKLDSCGTLPRRRNVGVDRMHRACGDWGQWRWRKWRWGRRMHGGFKLRPRRNLCQWRLLAGQQYVQWSTESVELHADWLRVGIRLRSGSGSECVLSVDLRLRSGDGHLGLHGGLRSRQPLRSIAAMRSEWWVSGWHGVRRCGYMRARLLGNTRNMQWRRRRLRWARRRARGSGTAALSRRFRMRHGAMRRRQRALPNGRRLRPEPDLREWGLWWHQSVARNLQWSR